MHNNLSRSMAQVPAWVIQAVVGALLTGAIAWSSWSTMQSMKHETRIAVVEQKDAAVHEDIHDIKESQKEMDKKLDRLLERRGH